MLNHYIEILEAIPGGGGEATAYAIARATGQNRRTVLNRCNEMVKMGWLRTIIRNGRGDGSTRYFVINGNGEIVRMVSTYYVVKSYSRDLKTGSVIVKLTDASGSEVRHDNDIPF